MNQSRNLDRKKITQMRLGTNATDMVFAQKKLSLKVDREQANKTSAARGIQLNQNDIVFSRTMNLSQFLSSQTKQGGNNGSSTTTNAQQSTSVGQSSAPISKNRATAESSQSRQAVLAHKRQKSGSNSQTWNSSVSGSQLHSLQGKPNPYIGSGNPSTI